MTYEGDFYKDYYHGWGKMSNPAFIYDGEWDMEKLNGKGTLTILES